VWKAIITDSNVDVVLPQFYGNGTDAAVQASGDSGFSVEDLCNTVRSDATIMPLLKINTLPAPRGGGGDWDTNTSNSVNTMTSACGSNGDNGHRMCDDGFMVYTGN
jgi:hypothetical protein